MAFAALVSCGRPEPAGVRAAPAAAFSSASSGAPSAVAIDGSTPTASLEPAYAKALEGDMRAALERLDASPPEALAPDDRPRRACMLQRFASRELPPIDVPDPFLAKLLGLYRGYWSRVLLGEASADAGRAQLLDGLRGMLVSPTDAAGPSPDLFEILGAALSQHGYHSIRGVTSPYQDLMVWASETRATYDVHIPGGTRRVEVVLMHDFVSLGWEGFATCDRHYPGGWAEKDRLFCMADAYDLSSEDFSVSYLAHETEHFADYERFPKLEGPELEYRAKLVELIESRVTTRALVARFASWPGERRESPHNYANRCIVRDLVRKLLGTGSGVDAGAWWDAVTDDGLRSAAQALFEESTRALQAKGAATATRFL
jgi:hypothetical protein